MKPLGPVFMGLRCEISPTRSVALVQIAVCQADSSRTYYGSHPWAEQGPYCAIQNRFATFPGGNRRAFLCSLGWLPEDMEPQRRKERKGRQAEERGKVLSLSFAVPFPISGCDAMQSCQKWRRGQVLTRDRRLWLFRMSSVRRCPHLRPDPSESHQIRHRGERNLGPVASLPP